MKVFEFYAWLAFFAVILLIRALFNLPLVLYAFMVRPVESTQLIAQLWEEARHVIWSEVNS